MKLVVDQATQKVIGVHMLGEDAPEIVQGLAIAGGNGCHQAGLRPHHRHPPDSSRRIRDVAHQDAGRRRREGSGIAGAAE